MISIWKNFSTKERKEVHKLDERLESLLRNMDLPWNRKKDFTHAKLQWLKKHMSVKNKDHKNYSEALATIETILRG